MLRFTLVSRSWLLLGCLAIGCGGYAVARAALATPESGFYGQCFGNLAQLSYPVTHAPRRVLIIPLLHKRRQSVETENWPERPAATLATYYRQHFAAEVTVLRNIRTWEDYYRAVGVLLARQAYPFDRVILIGHSGFDGPVLNKTILKRNWQEQQGKGAVLSVTTTQAGKNQVFTLHYQVATNPSFSAHIARSWYELTALDHDVAVERLRALKDRWQPLDQACFSRYCAPLQSAALSFDSREVMQKLDACQNVCREPLYTVKEQEEIDVERFYDFAASLTGLSRRGGVIFLGGCNPGSMTPERHEAWEKPPGLLTQSPQLGGPYPSYVHLLAESADRVTAGPVGDSSADDIVQRVMMMEVGRHQFRLCIVPPRRW